MSKQMSMVVTVEVPDDCPPHVVQEVIQWHLEITDLVHSELELDPSVVKFIAVHTPVVDQC